MYAVMFIIGWLGGLFVTLLLDEAIHLRMNKPSDRGGVCLASTSILLFAIFAAGARSFTRGRATAGTAFAIGVCACPLGLLTVFLISLVI